MAAMEGLGPGVMSLRTGDSGLGSEGRGSFICGLGARAPGPTDWLNLGIVGVGEVGLMLGMRRRPPRVLLLGVKGMEPAEPGPPLPSLRLALKVGTNIPAPGTFVEK